MKTFIYTLYLVISATCHPRKTIYDLVMEEPDLSGFRKMIKDNRMADLNLLYSSVTVLIPTVEAFQKSDGIYSDSIILYHIGSEMLTLEELKTNQSVRCVHGGNPPIWVTKIENDIFLNNAKILPNQSNYLSKAKRNHNAKQVLHVIDRMLDPLIATPSTTPPTALYLLEHPHDWNLGPITAFHFLKRIQFHAKTNLFTTNGGHTFFLPMDVHSEALRLQDISSYIIQSHIVPNMVLFTRSTRRNFVYETAANGDYVYVVVSLTTRNGRDYVRSYTVLGNTEHRKGEILAEIVKADVPVANGVAHFISRPLAVFDRELKPFPYLPVWYKIQADPFLNHTYFYGEEGGVNKILRRGGGMFTFFAPVDKAWNQYKGYSREKLSEILKRHLIVSSERHTIAKLAGYKISETVLETVGGSLGVSIFLEKGNYHVQWGQHTFKILRPDYECSDGVVHVVDGIFASQNIATTTSKPDSFWKMLKDLIPDGA